MDQATTTENTKSRLIANENVNLTINEYVEESASPSTKKLINQVKSLFNQTMDAYNQKENCNLSKNIDDYGLDELPSALSRFFMICVKTDGTKYNASSLQTYFRVLTRYFRFRDENPIDISTDVRFKKVNEVVKARSLESAKSGQRAGINASQSLTRSELRQVMASGAMSRDNPRSLISLVHYHLMTGFGCRAREECRAINNSDLIFGPESEEVPGLPQFISLSERITKTRRGGQNDKRDLEGRIYLDNKYPELCPVRTILFFNSKKTSKQSSPDYTFLLTVKQSAMKEPEKMHYWYIDQPMGVNYISKLFKTAIELSGVDIGAKKITGTSARKNLVQMGAEGSVPSPLLSKLLGQKGIDSKLEYLKNTNESHKAASLVISRGVQGVNNQDFSTVLNEVNGETTEETSAKLITETVVDDACSNQVVQPTHETCHQPENHYAPHDQHFHPPPSHVQPFHPPPSQDQYFHHPQCHNQYFNPPPPAYHGPMYNPHHVHGQFHPPPVPYHGQAYYPPPTPLQQYYGAHYHPYHHYPPYPRQHFSEPNYHNQNSFQQYNHNSYNFHAGPSSSNGQQASQSVKRPLTDVTNTFTFKKPRSDDKTFINL